MSLDKSLSDIVFIDFALAYKYENIKVINNSRNGTLALGNNAQNFLYAMKKKGLIEKVLFSLVIEDVDQNFQP